MSGYSKRKIRFTIALPDMAVDEVLQFDPQDFMYQLDLSAYIALPDLRSETYQELESSRRLSLLRDRQLRSTIARTLNDYRSARPVFTESLGDYCRILFDMLPGRSYYD